MKVNRTETIKGQDAFGAYNDMAIFWSDTIHTKNDGYEFGTIFRVYSNEPDIIVFIQVYPNGAVNTSAISSDEVISSFPSFLLDNKQLGFNQWGTYLHALFMHIAHSHTHNLIQVATWLVTMKLWAN